MHDFDKYGFFRSEEHLRRFTSYMQLIYKDDFLNFELELLPQNEVAYIYAMAYLLENDVIWDYSSFIIFKNMCDYYWTRENQKDSYLKDIAVECLEGKIVIDFTWISSHYENGILIKNMFDIVLGAFDLSSDKKIDVLLTSSYYLENILENESYDYLER